MSRNYPGNLAAIAEKIDTGARVSEEDALALYRHPDLDEVGSLAGRVRERLNGRIATYLHTQYVNYSNLCVLACQFCAFGARRRDPHAFELAPDEIVDRVRAALDEGVTEVHMVGGLHPTLEPEWYLDLLSSLRALSPALHIKAFTAIEIRHFADRIFRKPLDETLALLRAHGLDSITGGGAEIFDQGVRDRICRGKETAEEWAEVHRLWHQMGQRSTCTMLFGHVETLEQRVDHLARLRRLQDETGGFTGFVPFAFVPETTEMAHIPPASAEEQLRNIAVSRIFLDNIPHVTAYRVSLGLGLAQRSLRFGADDLHGTLVEEKILHMAGASTPQRMSVAKLCQTIRAAGFVPRQRDSHYNLLPPARSDVRNRAVPAAA